MTALRAGSQEQRERPSRNGERERSINSQRRWVWFWGPQMDVRVAREGRPSATWAGARLRCDRACPALGTDPIDRFDFSSGLGHGSCPEERAASRVALSLFAFALLPISLGKLGPENSTQCLLVFGEVRVPLAVRGPDRLASPTA